MKTILFSKSFAASALGMMLTFGSAAGLYSCSDDEFLAKVNIPEEKTITTGLEAYEQVLDLNIESDSEWRVEFEGDGDDIAYTWPQSGRGNANVKLHVLPNMGEVERKGSMKIIFPSDPSKNKVIPIVQKANTAGEDNLDRSLLGEQCYALGWGYNATRGLTPGKNLLARIIKPEYLQEDPKRVGKTADDGLKISVKTYTGSTVAELKSDFEAKADFEGGGFGFNAEMNASFNMNDFSNEQYEYALSYVTLAAEQNVINETSDALMEEECLVPSAYKALNNVNGRYPSTDEGFYDLVRKYGTHVVTKASLGGRLKVATQINTSKVTKEYDIHAFAKLSYSGIVDASASVEETYKQNWEENKNACETSISGIGGDKELLQAIATTTGDEQKEAINSWIKDVSADGHGSYMGLNGKDEVIGIWELVEDRERSKMLEEYIKSGRYITDSKETYDLGVQAHLTNVSKLISDMNSNNYRGSLIKRVTIGNDGNKTIALLCSEFIPEINEKSRVAVFYPVINGIPKFNLGLFLGNEYSKPAKICTYSGNMIVKPITDGNIGEHKDIYLRGSNISVNEIDDETPQVEASISDYTVPMWKDNRQYDYPLVKVRNNLWMRNSYASSAVNGYPLNYIEYGGRYYYNFAYTDIRETIGGWKLPQIEDINLLIKLCNDHAINFAKESKYNGCIGTDFDQEGYVRGTRPDFINIQDLYIPLYFEDSTDGYISCLKINRFNNSAEITRIPVGKRGNITSTNHYPLRYVKPIE